MVIQDDFSKLILQMNLKIVLQFLFVIIQVGYKIKLLKDLTNIYFPFKILDYRQCISQQIHYRLTMTYLKYKTFSLI